ncbi:MAG: SAM-dependent chlorinase/fluorinase [Acidobacteriota bacterium]
MPRTSSRTARSGIVTLLTDFGEEDAYVASMKGVVLAAARGATLVDLCHAIPPQDVRRAAMVLDGAVGHVPPGTVHLAVVDPGVGTSRRGIAVDAGRALFVGPDNGLFSLALRRFGTYRAHALPTPPGASATFHGRDVFAPSAARLCRGEEARRLGPEVKDLVVLDAPAPRRAAGRVEGEVVYVDRFGNLITNIHGDLLPVERGACRVRVGGRLRIEGISPTYGAAAAGRMVALVESTGHLEIAVRDGSAARRLRAGTGTPVVVESDR